MKSRIFCKSKFLFLLGLSCFIGPLSSCSAFFGGDEYTITDTKVTTDESGNTIVTITFSGEDIAPLTFTIPSVTDGVDGNGIANISSTLVDDKVTLTISYTDTTKEDTVITIPVVKGDTGKGISNVEVDSDEVGNTTLKFVYDDGTESDTITIPKGKDGTGIKTFNVTTNGIFNIITITFTDPSIPDQTITISNGKSIESIVYNDEASTDLSYVLTISYNDGTTEDIALERPIATKWHNGIADPEENFGQIGDYYINTSTGEIFVKENNGWRAIFSMSNAGDDSSKEFYTVSFNLRNGETFENSGKFGNVSFGIRIEEGSYVPINEIPIPFLENSTFEGWYSSNDVNNVNAGKFTNITPVFGNISLYAKWN